MDWARRNKIDDRTPEDLYKNSRRLAGEIIWAGNWCMPQESFNGSRMQQLEPMLRFIDLTNANKILAKKGPYCKDKIQKTNFIYRHRVN